MSISKDAEIERLRALLARCIKYAREDRMVTPGVTRLARALAEGEMLLAESFNAGGGEQVTHALAGPTLTSDALNAASDGPAPAPAEETASTWEKHAKSELKKARIISRRLDALLAAHAPAPAVDGSVCSHCDHGVIDVPDPITAKVCPWCNGNYRVPAPAVDEATVERIAEQLRNVFAFPANFTARLVAGDGVAGTLPILVAAAHSPEILAAIQRVAAEVRRG
jgi:hypothetical protein